MPCSRLEQARGDLHPAARRRRVVDGEDLGHLPVQGPSPRRFHFLAAALAEGCRRTRANSHAGSAACRRCLRDRMALAAHIDPHRERHHVARQWLRAPTAAAAAAIRVLMWLASRPAPAAGVGVAWRQLSGSGQRQRSGEDGQRYLALHDGPELLVAAGARRRTPCVLPRHPQTSNRGRSVACTRASGRHGSSSASLAIMKAVHLPAHLAHLRCAYPFHSISRVAPELTLGVRPALVWSACSIRAV